jgi:hypothetical protein
LFTDITMTANFGNHALVYHGTGSNVEWAWNYAEGTRSGWGINDGYAATETQTEVHFHHNRLKTVGTFSGQSASSIGWEMTYVAGMRVHDNITEDCAVSAYFYDDRNSGGSDSQLSDVFIGHNTFWQCPVLIGTANGGSGASLSNIDLGSNIFATDRAEIPFRKGNTVPDGELSMNKDLFYRSDAGTAVRWDNTGGSGADYASAAALTAVETQVESGGVTGNPSFTNAAAGDFSLGGGSPARNAGQDMRRKLGYAADYAGVTRNDTSPHIGAYETA